jgi:hypothetical protein
MRASIVCACLALGPLAHAVGSPDCARPAIERKKRDCLADCKPDDAKCQSRCERAARRRVDKCKRM